MVRKDDLDDRAAAHRVSAEDITFSGRLVVGVIAVTALAVTAWWGLYNHVDALDQHINTVDQHVMGLHKDVAAIEDHLGIQHADAGIHVGTPVVADDP